MRADSFDESGVRSRVQTFDIDDPEAKKKEAILLSKKEPLHKRLFGKVKDAFKDNKTKKQGAAAADDECEESKEADRSNQQDDQLRAILDNESAAVGTKKNSLMKMLRIAKKAKRTTFEGDENKRQANEMFAPI